MASTSNCSPDLVWEITRNYNSYLCKRKANGGVSLSRDPLNLTNKHSKKHAGFASEKAIGVTPGSSGGVTLTTKKKHRHHQPGSSLQVAVIGKGASDRKTLRSVVNSTTKRGYRPDLRQAAVARTSAIKKSQRQQKEDPPVKLRGKRARKAEE